MKPADKQQKEWNFIAGVVALSAVGVLVLLIALGAALKGTAGEPRHYVMYVKNAGTLGVGDPVYLNGRRVGRVHEVELVNREGGIQARVDFTLVGSASKLDFPVDSRAVVVGPGLVSGPSLVLQYGKNPSVIEPGGEFKETVPAPETDQVSSLAESALSIQKTITELEETIGDPEFLDAIRTSLAELRANMDELSAQAEEIGPQLGDLSTPLDGMAERIREVHAQLVEDARGLAEQLEALDEALKDGADNFDEIKGRTENAIAELNEMQRLSEEGAATAEDPALRQLFLRARWESASLAAQLDAARRNPGNAGGDPTGQQVREHFNGGKKALDRFGGDTDIDKFD